MDLLAPLEAAADGNFALSWNDGERVVYRGWRVGPGGERSRVLAVAAAVEQPAPGVLDRLAHEFALRGELDTAGSARPLELVQSRGRTVLLLQDPGGEPLTRLVGMPMPVSEFLPLAVAIAAALGKFHQRDLVHRDIKPANILVDRASEQAWLIGFGIASRLPRERQAPEPPETIAGTLAYMAPEQTGRMNRSVDSRSDLYAFGITLHEMLTGSLPFAAADPMERVHCHIARTPPAPCDRLPTIPEPISAIVMKLLAKPAEERYQTAAGLESDLRRCRAEWEAQGRINDFPLGANDTPDRLRITEKLYGRAHEIETLLAVFDRVATGSGPELVLVSGYSGVGKSSVVNELHKTLVPKRGLFAAGKFDQYNRDVPYATLGQALQGLIRPLLGLRDAELGRWRDRLRDALGPNARLMVDLVPELRLVIGEPPPVPKLGLQDAQRRFQLVLRRLVGVFARPEHLLVLFLDDLQWLDPATLDVLEDLLMQHDIRELLLIGAYRANEVDPAHPLQRKLEAIRPTGARVQEITLSPLTELDLAELLSDALHCATEATRGLARLVHAKTAGNPFFAIQFLAALADEGLLRFAHEEARWRWDLGSIYAKGYADNVVDLLVGKLARLPATSQSALQLLACLGNETGVATLCLMRGCGEDVVHAELWDAVRQELILRLGSGYKFVHDRVREAAYSLIPVETRAATHLRIGRLLLTRTSPERREEAIFEIVNHLNRGAGLTTAREEREQLAELNLIAGKRAKASTAYASALTYFVAGTALLAEDCWERQHDLALQLALSQAECEFLTGALADAEQRLIMLSARVANTVERAAAVSLSLDLYTTLGQNERAIAVGLDCLRHLGVDWSPHPTEAESRREYDRIWVQLARRPIEEILELPLMTDLASLATLDVLSKVFAAAMYTEANLACLAICRAVNLSLEHGNSDGSSFAYAMLGALAGARFGDYRAGYRFGQLGYELVAQRQLRGFQARVYNQFGTHVLPWTRPIRACRDLLRRAFEVANRNGDITFSAYSCHALTTNLLAAGDSLPEVQREVAHGLAFAEKSRFRVAIDLIAIQHALIRNLRGLTPRFGCFDDAQFGELRMEQHLASNPGLARAKFSYYTRKLQARFLAGDYASALNAASQGQSLLPALGFAVEAAEYRFYAALAHAGLCDSLSADRRAPHLEALAAHQRQFAIWATNCPENFEHRAALLAAEIARIEGRTLDAEHLYEQAIRSAQEGGFLHNEAVANELAARFYAGRGFEKIARLYRQEARYGYLRWGADGKVRQLDDLFPDLSASEAPPAATSTIGATVAHLDLAAVIRVSQALSGEMVLEKLLDTLMRIAIAHGGAQRGVLILGGGTEIRLAAEAITARDVVHVRILEEPVSGVALPESIVRFVVRTREPVILDDASTANLFSADPYILGHRAGSILCLPLINQAKLVGALYLENSLAPRVFTPSQIAILQLLASQAAISVENAQLYRNLEERESKIQHLIDGNIIGLMFCSREGRITDANEAFLRMVGYSRQDIRDGRLRLRDLTPPEWRKRQAEALAEIETTGSFQPYEREYLHKNGARVPVLVGGVVLTYDEGVAFVLDLTERKRAEQALRVREANIRRLVDANIIGVFVVDLEGRITEANETFLHMVGYEREDLISGRMHVLDMTPPEWRDFTARRLAEAAMGKTTQAYEKEYIRKDGSRVPVLVGSTVFEEERGKQGLAFVVDLTERKETEAEARESERRYREVHTALAHANRVATLGQLTASIAHEVNQPIAASVTNAQAALRWLRAERPDLEEVKQALERIVQNGNRAGEVVARTRALIKKAPPRKDGVPINDAILEVVALTHGEAKKTGVSVRTQLAEGLPPIEGDRVQLQQVILNLIVNAIEAMSGTDHATRELLLSTEKAEPGAVHVAVHDSGPGLEPAALERIFDPFYSTKPSGLGLGLPICRSIIEAHGGRLWASANLPRGAIFQFTVPARSGGAW